MNPQKDVETVLLQYGSNLTVYLVNNTNVTRDEYNEVKKATPTSYTFKAFPVYENPSDKQRDTVGIKEDVNIMAYVSMKEARKIFNIEDIDTEQIKFSVFNKRYECTQIQRFSQYKDDYLYLVFAGKYESKI